MRWFVRRPTNIVTEWYPRASWFSERVLLSPTSLLPPPGTSRPLSNHPVVLPSSPGHCPLPLRETPSPGSHPGPTWSSSSSLRLRRTVRFSEKKISRRLHNQNANPNHVALFSCFPSHLPVPPPSGGFKKYYVPRQSICPLRNPDRMSLPPTRFRRKYVRVLHSGTGGKKSLISEFHGVGGGNRAERETGPENQRAI